MADKAKNVVLNFKMDGQVKYAETLTQINNVMNTAAKEYKNHIEAMGKDATATDKLRAEKKKLEIQMEGAQKRTKMLSDEFEAMSKDTNTSSNELNKMYGKLLSAESAETKLKQSLDRVNEGLSDQAQEAREAMQTLDKLKGESKLLEAEQKALTSSIKLQNAELGENASESEKVELAQKQFKSQMELTEKTVKNLEEQLESTKNVYGENSVEVLQMETKINEARVSIANFNKTLGKVEESSNKAEDGMSGLGKTVNAAAFMEASEQLAVIGEKLIEIGQYALEAFREVDEGLDIIITKTGATGIASEALSEIFNDIAGNSPFEFGKIGEAIGELNTQFGFTGDVLKENSELLLKYAEINGTSVSDSAIKAKQNIEAYGLEYKDLGMVLDSTTSVAQSTGIKIDELSDKVLEGAPLIKALGLSFQEGASLIGQFEQAGVDSGAALSSLSKATIEYAEDGKTLKEGLAETIDKIKNSKDETEALNTAAEVFGTKGAVRMVDAIKRGAINLDDLASSAENTAGTVTETFNSTLDPIDEMAVTTNNAKLTMSELGDSLAVTLVPILKTLSDGLKSATDWFTNLSPVTRDIIIALGIATTAVTLLIPVVAALAVAVFALNTSLLPVIVVIVAVIAVIAGIILVMKNWGEITDWIGDKWVQFITWLSKVVPKLAADFVIWIMNLKNGAIGKFDELVVGGIAKFMGLKDGAFNVISAFKNSTISKASELKEEFIGKVTGLKDEAINRFNNLRDRAGEVMTSTKEKIISPIIDAKNKILEIVNSITGFFTNMKLSIPKISLPQMPKFSLTGEFSLNPPSVPKIGIEWFAQGGILTRPTAFGMNGNNIMAGGEAGPEAVLPLNAATLGAIGEGIAKTMNGNGAKVVINSRDDAESIARAVQRVYRQMAYEM